jgi:hypothetical protein
MRPDVSGDVQRAADEAASPLRLPEGRSIRANIGVEFKRRQMELKGVEGGD